MLGLSIPTRSFEVHGSLLPREVLGARLAARLDALHAPHPVPRRLRPRRGASINYVNTEGGEGGLDFIQGLRVI